MAKIFVSHRGVDTSAAEQLAQVLEAHGHAVWLDVREIDIGDSIIAKINDGLAGATVLILCLSDVGLSSWMDAEWMSTFARQLDGKGVRLLPARLTGGQLPAILADLKYADLACDWDAGVTSILKAIP